MLAQTNLQLYRQLLDIGYDDQSLAQVRAAYDLTRQLFIGSYRPSEKPFCAHLVGTASVLVCWGERTDMVVAGMLHSAYLYGEFGDRTRGISPAKQRALIARIGEQAQALVEQYSKAAQEARSCSLEQLAKDPQSRDIVVLKLADLLDECADAGPLYAPHKKLTNGLPHDRNARSKVLDLAEEMVGGMARANFATVFQEIDSCQLSPVLVNQKQASGTVASGVPELRISNMRRRILRLVKRSQIR